ncbi:MAG: thiamine phosphate synthase [Vicinamibacterales bacterium]
MSVDHPRVLLVTDSRRLVPGAAIDARLHALERQAREAFAAGVDAVQIRERDLDGAALFDLTRAIAALGRVVVTDRVDVAVAAGASGVHLRADGPEPARVRPLLAPGMTLSRAVHDAAEAARFGGDAALDWLIAGPAFETESKPGRAPLGPDGVRTIARASRLPVVAIGGVTPANARDLLAAGAAGVAAIGLFLSPPAREDVDSLRDRSLE